MSETGESDTRDDVAGSSGQSTTTSQEMSEIIKNMVIGGIDLLSSDDVSSTPGRKKNKKKKKKKNEIVIPVELDDEPPHLFPDDCEPNVPSEVEIMEFDGQWPPWQGGQFGKRGRPPRQRPFVHRGGWGRGNRGRNDGEFMNMQQSFRGRNFSGRGARFQHPPNFNPQDDGPEFMGSMYQDFESGTHNMGGPHPPPHNNMCGPRPPPHNNMGGPRPPPHNNMGGPRPPLHNNMGGPLPPPHNMGGPQSQMNEPFHPNQDRIHDGNRGQPSLLGDGPMQFRMGKRFRGNHQCRPGEGPGHFGTQQGDQFQGFHGDGHMQHHEDLLGYESNPPPPPPPQQFEDRTGASEQKPQHLQGIPHEFSQGMPPLPLDFELPDFAKQQEQLLQELSKAPVVPLEPSQSSGKLDQGLVPDALDHIPMPPPPQQLAAPKLPPPQPPMPQQPASVPPPLPQTPEVPQPTLPQQPTTLPPQPPTEFPWQLNQHAIPPLQQLASVAPPLPQTHPVAPLLTQNDIVALPLPQIHPVAPLLTQNDIVAPPLPHTHPVAPPLPQIHPVVVPPLPQTHPVVVPLPQTHPVAPTLQQTHPLPVPPPLTASEELASQPDEQQAAAVPVAAPSAIQTDLPTSTKEENLNETIPQQSSDDNISDSLYTQILPPIDPIKSTAMKLLEKFQQKKKAESQTQEKDSTVTQVNKVSVNLRSGLRPGLKSKVSLTSGSRIQFALKNSAKVTNQSNPLKLRLSTGDDEEDEDAKILDSNKESSDTSKESTTMPIAKEKSIIAEQKITDKVMNPTVHDMELEIGSRIKDTVAITREKEGAVASPKEPKMNQGSNDSCGRSTSPKSKDESWGSRSRSKDHRRRSRSPEVDRKTRSSDSWRKTREYRGRSKSPESTDRKSRLSRRRQSSDDEGSPESRKNKSRSRHEKSRSRTPDARPDSSEGRKSKRAKEYERSMSPDSRSRKDSYSGRSKSKQAGDSSREKSEERRIKGSSRLWERSQRSSSASDAEGEDSVLKSKTKDQSGKENKERNKRKSEDSKLHLREDSDDETNSSYKNITSKWKTDRNTCKIEKSEEIEAHDESYLHHIHVSSSGLDKDSARSKREKSEVDQSIIKKANDEIEERSPSREISLEKESDGKQSTRGNSEASRSHQKQDDEKSSHRKHSPDHDRERKKRGKSEEEINRKLDEKDRNDERSLKHLYDHERDSEKAYGRSDESHRKRDERWLVKKDSQGVEEKKKEKGRNKSPDVEEPRRRRSRRFHTSPDHKESHRKSRWSPEQENEQKEDEDSVKINPLVSYDSPMKEVAPLVSYDSPMKDVVPLVSYDSPLKGSVPLVSYDSPKTGPQVSSSIVTLRPLVQYDSEDDSDMDSERKVAKGSDENVTKKKLHQSGATEIIDSGTKEQPSSLAVDNIRSVGDKDISSVTGVTETKSQLTSAISGEATAVNIDKTLPVDYVTETADVEKGITDIKESEKVQDILPNMSNKIIQAYEDFEKFLNETSLDTTTEQTAESSGISKDLTLTTVENTATEDKSCKSADESETPAANDSKVKDGLELDLKEISDSKNKDITLVSTQDMVTSEMSLKKSQEIPSDPLEEESGRRSLRSRRSYTSESQESSPRESRRSKRMSKEEKVTNEVVTPEAGRMTRSRRLRSRDESDAPEDQGTGKKIIENSEDGYTGRRKTRSQRSVDESRDSSRETRSSKRSRRHRNRSGSSSDHEKEDRNLKFPKEIDKKLSSPISVDLSSIALPGEGIKIRIFSDSHSPDKKGDKPFEKRAELNESEEKVTLPPIIDLASIILPPEPTNLPEAVKSTFTEPPPAVAMETESPSQSDVTIDKPVSSEATKLEEKNMKFVGVKNEKLRAAMEKLQAEKNASNIEGKDVGSMKVEESKEQSGKISLSFGRRLTRGRVLKTPSALTDDVDSETRQPIKFGLQKAIVPLKTGPTWEEDESTLDSKGQKSDSLITCDPLVPKSDLLMKCDPVVPTTDCHVQLEQIKPKSDSFVNCEDESTIVPADESEMKKTGIKIEVKGIRTRSKVKDSPETDITSKPDPIVHQQSWRKSTTSQMETDDASNDIDISTEGSVSTGSDFKKSVVVLPSSDGDTRAPNIEEEPLKDVKEKTVPDSTDEVPMFAVSNQAKSDLTVISAEKPSITLPKGQDSTENHTQVDEEISFKNIVMPDASIAQPKTDIQNEGTNYENEDMDLDDDSEMELELQLEVSSMSEEKCDKVLTGEDIVNKMSEEKLDKSSHTENSGVIKDSGIYTESESRVSSVSSVRDIALPSEESRKHIESESRASSVSSVRNIALPGEESRKHIESESRASYADKTDTVCVGKDAVNTSISVSSETIDTSIPSQNFDVPASSGADSKATEEKKAEPVSIKPFTIGRKPEKIIVNIKTMIESPINDKTDTPKPNNDNKNERNLLLATGKNINVNQTVPSLWEKTMTETISTDGKQIPKTTSTVSHFQEDTGSSTAVGRKSGEITLSTSRDEEANRQSIISSPGGFPMEIISEDAIKLKKFSFIGRELITHMEPKSSRTLEADSVSGMQKNPCVLELAHGAESEKADTSKTMSGALLTDKVLCNIPLPDVELPASEKEKKDNMEEGEILSESEGDKHPEEKVRESGNREHGIGTVITRFSEEPANKIQVICANDKPTKPRSRWSAIETVVSSVPVPDVVPAAEELNIAEENIALKAASKPTLVPTGDSNQSVEEGTTWSQKSMQEIQSTLVYDHNTTDYRNREYNRYKSSNDQFDDRFSDRYSSRGEKAHFKQEHDRFDEAEIGQLEGEKDRGWYEERNWDNERYNDRDRSRFDKRKKHSREYDDYDQDRERFDKRGNNRSADRDRTPERRRDRNRMRDQSRDRDRTPERSRDRRDRTPDRNRDRDRSSDHRRAHSRDRSRDRDRDRNRRHRERDDRHHRRRSMQSRDRSRERSRDRGRDHSRDRTRNRSRDRTRDRSGDRTRDRSREVSRDRDKRSHRDYDEEDRSIKRQSDRDREKEKDRDRDEKSSKEKQSDKTDSSWLEFEAKFTGKDGTKKMSAIPTSNQSSDYVQSMYNVFFQKTSSCSSTGTTITQSNAAEYYQNYPDYQQHGGAAGSMVEGMYPTTGNRAPTMHQVPPQPAEMPMFGSQYQQTPTQAPLPNQHGFQQFPLSGPTPQGLLPQGIPSQGPQSQGIAAQGPTTQGVAGQGPPPQGIPGQGPPPQGIPCQGLLPGHQGIPPVQSTGLQGQGVAAQGLHNQAPQALQPQSVDMGLNMAPHMRGQLNPSTLIQQTPGHSALPLQPSMGNPPYMEQQQHMYSSQTAVYPPKGLPSTNPVPPSLGSQGQAPIQRLYPEEVAPPTGIANIPDSRYKTMSPSTSSFIQTPQNTTHHHIPTQETQVPPLQRMFGKKIQVSSSFENSEPKPVVSSTAKMLPAPFPKAPQDQTLLKDIPEPTASSTLSSMTRKRFGKSSSPRSHLFSKMSLPEDVTQVPTSSEEKVSEVAVSPSGSTPPQPSSSPALPTSSVSDFPASINVPHGVPIKLGIKQELQARKEMEQAMTSPPASSRPFKVKSRWLRFSELESPLPPPSPPGDSNLPTSTSSEGMSQKTEISSDGQQNEERETIPSKQSVEVKKESYDAWDPSSDLVISPTVNLKGDKPSRKEGKRKEKEREKEKPVPPPVPVEEVKIKEEEEKEEEEEMVDENKPPHFDRIEDNIYLGERKKSKKMKEVRRMLCDCTATQEDREMGLLACGEDCLNRMLYIECGSRCQCGEYCTNKRIQKKQYSDVEPFRTSWKGFGLKTNEELVPGQFVMEYVGEVLDYRQFKSRTKQYAKSGQQHYYFMALNADEVIDATTRGNISRFINHSCDPNCETQKWTVNGALRVGFFARKYIDAETELTFDYQFELYGKEAQKCFCGTEKCRGFIGSTKNTPVTKGRKRVEEEEVEEEEKKTKQELFEDELEQELEEMTSQGLMSTENVLTLCRLMVRAEDTEHRLTLLNVLQVTTERNCLRLFLDYHGLELLWTWIVDLRDDGPDIKMQILSTLKILPITNKTILKDSKILAIIQRLAEKENSDESSGQVISSTPPVGQVTPSTPPTSSKEKPTSILSITTTKENKSGKKKVKFALEDASSSDNESRTSNSDSFSDIIGNELYTDFDSPPSTESSKKRILRSSKKDGVSVLCRQVLDKQDPLTETMDSEVSESCAASTSQENITQEHEIDSTENDDKLSSEKDCAIPCMESETTVTAADSSDSKSECPTDHVAADSSSSSNVELNLDTDEVEKDNVTECDSSEPKDDIVDVVSLAEDLLRHWSDLKEIFRIPKKEQVEERKRIERQLLDVRPTKQRQREKFERLQDQTRIRAAGWDTGIRKRKRPPPPPPPSEDDDDPSKPRKTLLPSPPKMTKEQRRQRFEADVKAHDEMLAEHQRQQEEIFLQQQQQLLGDPTYLYFQQTLVQHGCAPEMAQLHIQALLQEGHSADTIIAQLATQLQQGFQQQVSIDGSMEPTFQDPSLQQLLNPEYQAQQQAQQAMLQSSMAYAEDGQVQQQQQQLMYQQQQGQFQSQAELVAQQQSQGMTQAQALATGAQALAYQQQQQQQQQQQGALDQQAAQMSSDPQSIAYMQQIQQLQQQLQIQSQLAALSQGVAPAEEEDVPPPPSPPKTKQTKLPPNWKSAKDSDGKTYYYHTITRQTQWDTPTWDCTQDDSMDMCTPPMEEVKPVKKSSKQTTTAAADTSSELAKKIKDQFRNKMSSYVVVCLNPYRKPDCKMGHISSTDDFKHLARKLTHHVMAKELKHCHHVEDLEVNENVKAKAKDYVKKYMGKFGSMYRKTGSPDD